MLRSRERPVQNEPLTREVLVLRKTIELGPRARMPVLWDTGESSEERRVGSGLADARR